MTSFLSNLTLKNGDFVSLASNFENTVNKYNTNQLGSAFTENVALG